MTRRTWEHSYSNMMARCYRVANKDYHSYGGRGITVCAEWKNNPKQFYADMGDKPEGMTLDRIDPNKGYSPDNCRWASWKQQGRNRTDNTIVEFNGVKMCVSEAAELSGEWRLLGAIESMNGVMIFGLTTAFLFNAMLELRPVRHK